MKPSRKSSSIGVLELAPRRGRPRKFTGPARAVTLTVPEDVLAALGAIDDDLSRAVVRVTQPQMKKRSHPPAELVRFGRRAVIVVNPTHTLEERTGVLLVPLSDGRALISFDESTTPNRLELNVLDALEGGQLTAQDARVFQAILEILRSARRSPGVKLVQRSIVVLEPTSRSTGASPKADTSRRQL